MNQQSQAFKALTYSSPSLRPQPAPPVVPNKGQCQEINKSVLLGKQDWQQRRRNSKM